MNRLASMWRALAIVAAFLCVVFVTGAPRAGEHAAGEGSAADEGSSAPVGSAKEHEADHDKDHDKAHDKDAKEADSKGAKEGDAKGGDGEEETTIPELPNRKGEQQLIGLVITGISKVDPIKNLFEFDGVLTMRTKGAIAKCDKAKLAQMIEGDVKKADEVFQHTDESGEKMRSCRITVELPGDIDVRAFPFDTQELVVEIGDESDALEGVEYKADPDHTDVTPNVKIAGWNVGQITAESKQITDPSTKHTMAKAVFSVPLQRQAFASFVKGLLAVIFQLMIALIAVLLRAKNITNRISMVTGALIAVAATHNTVSSAIGVSYLTTADKLFLVSYFILLLNIGVSVVILQADDAKNEKRVNALFKNSLIAFPLVTLVLVTLILLRVI